MNEHRKKETKISRWIVREVEKAENFKKSDILFIKMLKENTTKASFTIFNYRLNTSQARFRPHAGQFIIDFKNILFFFFFFFFFLQ